MNIEKANKFLLDTRLRIPWDFKNRQIVEHNEVSTQLESSLRILSIETENVTLNMNNRILSKVITRLVADFEATREEIPIETREVLSESLEFLQKEDQILVNKVLKSYD